MEANKETLTKLLCPSIVCTLDDQITVLTRTVFMTKCPLDTGLFDRNTHTRGAAPRTRNFSNTFSKSKFPKDKIPKLDQNSPMMRFENVLNWSKWTFVHNNPMMTIIFYWSKWTFVHNTPVMTIMELFWTKVHFDQFGVFYHHGIILNKSSLWSIKDDCHHWMVVNISSLWSIKDD